MAETTDPITARQMLAEIALLTLPTPEEISFRAGESSVFITLATVADGLKWARKLGGKSHSYEYSDGNRYLSPGLIKWHGWEVTLYATEPIKTPLGEPLDRATRHALASVALGSVAGGTE